MYYKTKLSFGEIKAGYVCQLIENYGLVKKGTYGVVSKGGQEHQEPDKEKSIIVNFGTDDEVITEEFLPKLSFATVEDPEKKVDQKIATLQSERSVVDLLVYIQAQLGIIKEDPIYKTPITDEMLAMNVTRSIAALSIKLRLRGAEEILQLMEKLLTTDPETKDVRSVERNVGL
jgi:hypothetical protein